MERGEDGRRWLAGYLHAPPAQAQAAAEPLTCPDHPDTRLVRVLGQAWICPTCLRPQPAP